MSSKLPWIAPAKLEEIKSLPIIDVAHDLDIHAIDGRNIRCFFNDHRDSNASLHFSSRKNNWYCYGCNKGGGVVELVMAVKGFTFLEAAHWLGNKYGLISGHTISSSPRKPNITVDKALMTDVSYSTEPDQEVLEWILANSRLSSDGWRYLCEERLFDPEVIRTQQIFSIDDGFAFIKSLINRFGQKRAMSSQLVKVGKADKLYSALGFKVVVFPFFDEEGCLVNLQSRSYVECKKEYRYKFLSGLPTRIYNIESIYKFAKDEPLYIAEGIPDCLAMLSDGLNAVAIPGAWNVCSEDVIYLRMHRLMMYPDNDEAGTKLYETLTKEYGLNITRMDVPQDFGDYADYYKSKRNGGI